MNWRNVFAIVQKDLLEVRQNKAAWIPMLIIPLIFVLLLPLGIIYVPQIDPNAAQSMLNDPDIQVMLDHAPAMVLGLLDGLNPMQSMVMLMLGYILAPLFLIFPLAFSSVVAAESFAGERERKTLEALLYTPASEAELFMGKVTTALIPSVGITWVSFLLYAVVLNVGGYSLFGHIWFPIPTWYPLIFWIAPALALLGISVTVLISARVQTFMGAYQLSASLVVIVLAFLIGQLTGVLYFTVGVGLLVGAVFWVIAGVLCWIALRGFNRSQLLLTSKE